MTFWGNMGFNTGFDIGNWYFTGMPSYSYFSSYSFPFFNFSPFNIQNIWNQPVSKPKPVEVEPAVKPAEETTEYLLPTMSLDSPFDTFTRTETKTKTETEIKQKTDNVTLERYNAKAGQRLARIALNDSIGWTGFCARSVKKAISKAGLGAYQLGHAYQMPSILRNNKNFKEISVDTADVSKLPAGCVLVYGKGKAGYSKDYGHTEITTGDGRAVSDGITRNLYKKPSAIFVPV